MQTNQNTQKSKQNDTNLKQSVTTVGYKEANYTYDHHFNQHPSKGLVKSSQPSLNPSSIKDQMEVDKFRKETRANIKNGDSIQDYKTINDQITDEELADENGHGNTL
jgi:hypothetical protein